MRKIALVIGLLFLILLDGHLTTLLINSFPNDFEVISHVFLIFMIVLARDLSFWENLIVFGVLGLIYDAYYFDLLGVATVMYPFFAIALNQVSRVLRMKLVNLLLIQVILVFLFDIISYAISQGLGLGGLRFDLFVVQLLAPSLVFHFFLVLLLYPLFVKISRKTRHRIVTSM